MCGIAGIATGLRIEPGDLYGYLVSMRDTMYHRGPDDEGVFIAPHGDVGLANRRLAVQDLSPAGHMPMVSRNKNVAITYNGEIYNAGELRQELEKLGYVFRSSSDTEVILNGYEAWGGDVAGRLRGMFAYAICDLRGSETSLLLARDRLGVKPLYYVEIGSTLLFASEVRALLASGLLSPSVSPAGLVGYLMLGSVPSPWTIYRHIKSLPPASCLEWRPTDWSIRRYWQFSQARERVGGVSAKEQIKDTLAESVRIRLLSDVPLGAFLSGGLDSSAVVALMRKATNGTIRTCSLVFEDEEYNEGVYARAMADAVGADHYEKLVTASEIVASVPNIISAYDQPSVDGINTYLVSKTAREAGLTVALSGLGGDELFAGYPNTFGGIPRLIRLLNIVRRIPKSEQLAGIAVRSPINDRWIKALESASRPVNAASAYLAIRGLFSPLYVQQLVHPDLWHEALSELDAIDYIDRNAGSSAASEGSSGSLMGWIRRAELSVYMHNQLLRDTDTMSMCHSLEVREPLLDVHLIEQIMCLPDSMLLGDGNGPKRLLVNCLGELLPPLVRERRDKKGFTLPFERWLRGPLSPYVNEARHDLRMSSALNSAALDALYRAYLEGRVHWSRLWAVVVLRNFVCTC